MSTHKIEDLLGEGHNRFTSLQRLLATASNQKQWTAEFRALVDPSLRNEVQVTDIRGPIVLVLCSNAAIATRLRFMLPEVRSALSELQSFSQVKDYKIRVSGH